MKSFTARVRSDADSDTYSRIVDAMIAVVAERGLAQTTMTKVAARAGVTRGAIQHYFGNRRVELIAKVCDVILARQRATYFAFVPILRDRKFDALRDLLKNSYRDPENWFLIEAMAACKGDPPLNRRIRRALNQEETPIDSTVQSLLLEHGASVAEFQTVTLALRALARGLCIEHARRPDQELWDRAVDLCLDALTAYFAKDAAKSARRGKPAVAKRKKSQRGRSGRSKPPSSG